MTTDTFKFQSHGVHPVKRSGFAVTHAAFYTSTSVQGHTIRTGVTIDCARQPPQGSSGYTEEQWWFHLYVMFSRVTRMEDMLLLRPPPRELLERGPPAAILRALERFIRLEWESVAEAAELCNSFGFALPEGVPQTASPARRRLLRKTAPSASESRRAPFVPSNAFVGERPGYHFKNGPGGLGYCLDPQGR